MNKLTGTYLRAKSIALAAGFAAVIAAAAVLLGGDFLPFVKWWLAVAAAGLAFLPLTIKLFPAFADRGWLFGKVLGIALGGFVCWALVCAGAFRFETPAVIGCMGIPAAGLWAAYLIKGRKQELLRQNKEKTDLFLLLFEELLFLALFLMWSYFTCFRPEARGTEKFMDYGFMATLYRDGTLPAADIWFGPEKLNYYYGGQYYAVYLTRLSFNGIEQGYNLARNTVAAFTFALPFSLMTCMVRRQNRKRFAAPAAGLLAGAAVGLAGNMHYVLYGLFGTVLKPAGYENYWFPSSTRYIGHNPLTADQCIHEFPVYSFVLGDLHAHMVNLMFVLTLLGILAAYFCTLDTTPAEREGTPAVVKLVKVLFSPHLWLLGFFIGLFKFTNYWDFVIYFTVTAIGLALMAIRSGRGRGPESFAALILRLVWIGVIATLVSLPFTLSFKTMVSGIAAVKYRTAFYQLAVLWALPVCALLLLFFFTLAKSLREKKEKHSLGKYLRSLSLTDLFMLLSGFCGLGLVLLPELVYVRDIYENGYARANTMFKLTYQAFVLLALCMAYAVVRLLGHAKRKAVRVAATAVLVLFILTLGYFPYSVNAWFGDVTDRSAFVGLDATAFLEKEYPADAKAIRWLSETVEGSVMILEANGDSYSDNGRVSAMTGLPTPLGWYVHEWLWRNDVASLNERVYDIRQIYTGQDADTVRALLKRYSVEYIFIGSCERKAFTDLNEEMLLDMGTLVYGSPAHPEEAMVVKVSK